VLSRYWLSVIFPKEFPMFRIALPHFVQFSVGTHRAAGVIAKAGAVRNADESKTLAGMLLAAALAALLVVADQLIEMWADGHLLLGWVALWTVTFAALALLAPPLRQLTSVLASAVTRWSNEAKERRIEEKMWEYASQDYRVMAEIQQAAARSQD
jgi:chromate transport protein ChrA